MVYTVLKQANGGLFDWQEAGMSLEAYLAYCLACLVLAAVPGPTVTVIFANSLRQGSRAGLVNAAGTQLGMLAWLLLAGLGLNALLHSMETVFTVLRWLAAAYLVWLGIGILRNGGGFSSAVEALTPRGNLFWQGFAVLIANPKMLVLYGAVIPPLLHEGSSLLLQTVNLGLTFMVLSFGSHVAYALAGSRARQWLSTGKARVIEVLSGLFLIGAGLWLASVRGR